MSEAVLVRRATIDDLDEAARLFALYREFYGYPLDDTAAREYLRARIEGADSVILLGYRPSDGDAVAGAQAVAGGFALADGDVAGRGQAASGQAVGFCQLYPSYCSLDLAPIFVLYDLFVDSSARRSGVARSLLAAAAAHGVEVGASRLELSTANDNSAAQQLYESLGWMPDETYRHYELPVPRT
ncbi:GNAT family N-acetyltransferase [Subtercola lobariae]|uniref:N-acetyltransferase n=1 Tax=Subtercola lobariae TaxID=1588641 RepID=A0A917B483_9MICO|nr:GNAT family N-acetyltransferase [Subtercola lobariae]GGF18806.1 N-acetyltransferase [Subtercola lobariae]